jgi:SpoVK/Ycf46/Vps4 family AAA+-type ATPase
VLIGHHSAKARRAAPAILFLDEVDAIVGNRVRVPTSLADLAQSSLFVCSHHRLLRTWLLHQPLPTASHLVATPAITDCFALGCCTSHHHRLLRTWLLHQPSLTASHLVATPAITDCFARVRAVFVERLTHGEQRTLCMRTLSMLTGGNDPVSMVRRWAGRTVGACRKGLLASAASCPFYVTVY